MTTFAARSIGGIASRDSRRGMKLAGYLWRLWQMRGHIQEGRIRLHQMLALKADFLDRVYSAMDI